jgi:hypothetical protein
MIIEELLEDLYKAISKPQSKYDLAECLGLTVSELMLLLDFHVPKNHEIHEHEGQIQLVKVDPVLCGHIVLRDQCQRRAKRSNHSCGRHSGKGTLSPELRELALYLHKRGIPKSWVQDRETRRVKNIVICQRSPRTKKDRSFLALVASMQKKALNGESTAAEEEKLRAIIRKSCPARPRDYHEAVQVCLGCSPVVLCEERARPPPTVPPPDPHVPPIYICRYHMNSKRSSKNPPLSIGMFGAPFEANLRLKAPRYPENFFRIRKGDWLMNF